MRDLHDIRTHVWMLDSHSPRLCDAGTHVWPLHSCSLFVYVTLVHTIVITFFLS